jgi:hypothetical protein
VKNDTQRGPCSTDWLAEWKEDWVRNERYRSPEFWNQRAPSFVKHVSESDYSEQFLHIMQPEKSWAVIDVASGAGTIALPLASKVRHVTALDFSPVMIDLLRGACQQNGIENIRPVLASWEDDWSALGITAHDVAVASRSLIVEDPRVALEKLNAIATRRVFVSLPVGDGPFDRKLFKAVGRQLPRRPDYLFAYNILYQMGIYANVAFVSTNRDKRYGSEAAACESLLWMFPDLNENEKARFQNFLSEHLIREGSEFRFDYDRTVPWAVLWWNKELRQR